MRNEGVISLSKNYIETYVGDVLPIELVGDGINSEADVRWSADGEVAGVRAFCGNELSPRNVALVSVWGEGCGFVCAEYLGKKYEARVTSRKMLIPDGNLNYYRADLHAHTSTEHDHDLFALHKTEDIPDYISAVAADGALDLTVISDHAAVTSDRDFYRGFKYAEHTLSPVVMAGAESEVEYVEPDRFGIEHRRSGELVVIGSAGYAATSDWEAFEREMTYSPMPVAIFAHPHVVGYSTPGIWNFDFPKRATDIMLRTVRGIEMGSGTPFKENILHEYAISSALDAGFRLSTTCSGDCHGPDWGFGFCPGKTVVIAREKSREAFHEALRACRFYATESGRVKLKYSVNGSVAPTELAPTDTYRFRIELDLFEPDMSAMPTLCEIITDYGEVAHRCSITDRITELEIKSDTARYFYLRLVDGCGRKTWSMPVWCGRPFDEGVVQPTLTPVDMSAFSATADGEAAPELIDGNPYNSYTAKTKTPKIIIDMKNTRRISAIGYYPHRVVRDSSKAPDWNTHDESPSLLSEYNIYLSCDGEKYTLVKRVNCRTLGEENVETFAPSEARYIMLEVTETVGMNSHIEEYVDRCARIGNISVFE